MTDIRQRLADALVQAAIEGDDTPKVTVSMRVLEIMAEEKVGRTAIDVPEVRNRVLNWIHAAGITKDEFARRAGIDRATFFRFADPEYEFTPSTRTLQKLLAVVDGGCSTPGGRLRQARRAKGLSAADLARRVELSESAIRNQENGINGIPSWKAPAYAEILGVSIDWLLTGTGDGPSIAA